MATFNLPRPEPQNHHTLDYAIPEAANGKAAYRVTLRRDGNRTVATCPMLQGVVCDGATDGEAMKNMRYAIDDMLDALDMVHGEYELERAITLNA
jgi:predicted RNase H-like HicB family nuclease